MTAKGTVRVNEFLEVPGHPGVFAGGDIIDWEEQKQAAKAGTHAQVIIANVTSFLEGKPLKKAYKGSPELIIIPIGKVRVLFVVTGGLVADVRVRLCRLAVPVTWVSCGVSSWAAGLHGR